MSMAAFAGLILLYSMGRAVLTGRWFAVFTGLCLCVWTLDLGAKVRRRIRWAWWVAFIGAFTYSVRWAVGSSLQAWRIHRGNPEWMLAILEPLLLFVCLRTCAALLDRRSREAFGLAKLKNPPSEPGPLAEP
jgi:hypothetical protein